MTDLPSNLPRLLIRPSLSEGESLRGYVSRLSFANGSSPLLTNVQRSLRAISDAIPQISSLSGCNETILRAHGCITQFHRNMPSCVLFGSAILPLELIWLERKKLCPLCLLSQDISKCYWELKDYDVCHLHGCYLITNCEACGRNLRWGLSVAAKYQCGLLHSQMKAKIASTTRSQLCELIADATIQSISLSQEKSSISAKLAPLNRFFYASNFLLSILIPAFFQEHLAKIRSISYQKREELLLALLADKTYCDHLHKFILIYYDRGLVTMKKAIRLGLLDAAIKSEFRQYYKLIPLHEKFFEVKSEILRHQESASRQEKKLLTPEKIYQYKSANFLLKNVSSQ